MDSISLKTRTSKFQRSIQYTSIWRWEVVRGLLEDTRGHPQGRVEQPRGEEV